MYFNYMYNWRESAYLYVMIRSDETGGNEDTLDGMTQSLKARERGGGIEGEFDIDHNGLRVFVISYKPITSWGQNSWGAPNYKFT